jgi:hypothetical protein
MMPSFEEANKLNKQFLGSGLKSVAALAKSMQAVVVETTDYSKTALESGAAALEDLASAKSLEKAIEVQADFAKQAYQALVTQASKMTRLYADMAKEAYKPFESAAAKAK